MIKVGGEKDVIEKYRIKVFCRGLETTKPGQWPGYMG
jgi:hypothetical protein